MEGKVHISDDTQDNIVALCRYAFWQKTEGKNNVNYVFWIMCFSTCDASDDHLKDETASKRIWRLKIPFEPQLSFIIDLMFFLLWTWQNSTLEGHFVFPHTFLKWKKDCLLSAGDIS